MRRSIQFRPGLVEQLEPIAVLEKRSVNWLVNEAVEVFLGGGVVGPVSGPSLERLDPQAEPVVSSGVREVTMDTRAPSLGDDRPQGGSQSISTPADVPAAIRRVAPSRTFTPYSKEQQTGKAAKKAKPTVEVKSCRHGLLRCKVCGTG